MRSVIVSIAFLFVSSAQAYTTVNCSASAPTPNPPTAIYSSNASCAIGIYNYGSYMYLEYRRGSANLDNCRGAGPYQLNRVNETTYEGQGQKLYILDGNNILVYKGSKRYIFSWAKSF